MFAYPCLPVKCKLLKAHTLALSRLECRQPMSLQCSLFSKQ